MIKLKLFIAAVIVFALPASFAQAPSGTFLIAHDLGFGGSENADPIHPNRFWQVTEKTMNRLVRPSAAGEPTPDLAVSWSANDSATEWTFKLRKGIKFHDGTDFDACDVVDLLIRF